MNENDDAMTMNQVVALNVRRARTDVRNWTQREACVGLGKALGQKPWTVAAWSAMERSVDGTRVRAFDADLLIGLSIAFDLPVLWFFVPPDDVTLKLGGGQWPPEVLVPALVPKPDDDGTRLLNRQLGVLLRAAGMESTGAVNRAFLGAHLDAVRTWEYTLYEIASALARAEHMLLDESRPSHVDTEEPPDDVPDEPSPEENAFLEARPEQ